VNELHTNPSPSQDLAGLRLLITAGGTREPIDPVRFIGNRSSGKQGHALADEAASRGAAVRLVTTTNRPTPVGAEVIPVETAADMEAAVLARADDSDVVIMAAAVADFRPKAPADHKLKKTEGVPEVVLEQTPDILAELGRRRRPGQVLVGFAAETVASRGPGQAGDLRAYAEQKLRGKHLDLVVANDVSAPGAGFEHDTNAVLVLGADGTAIEVPLADKRAIARTILDAVVTLLPRSHR
jgi:phosphopantothenoylcysteine decarboxylase/phosphopantothenate--cysteine ligase